MKIFKSKIVKSVGSLVAGTAGAQLISFLVAPLITRLYGPDIYGVYGSFLAVLGILVPISGASFYLAVVIPKVDYIAERLVELSIKINNHIFWIISFIVFVAYYLSTFKVCFSIDYVWLFLPICFFVSGSYEIYQQLLIRNKKFYVISLINITTVVIVGVLQITMGWYEPNASFLVFSYLIGFLFKSYLSKRCIRYFLINIDLSFIRLNSTAKLYYDFPAYRMPQILLSSISFALPVLFLASTFGQAFAGFYTLARSVIGLPVNLIGGAVQSVLSPYFSDLFNDRVDFKRIRNLYGRSILLLTIICISPFFILYFFSPYLFSLIFGKGWGDAGVIASNLCPWLFFMTISRPAIALIPILRKQRWLLIYEVSSLILRTSALIFGMYYFNDAYKTIFLFSIVGSLLYLYLIIYIGYFTGFKLMKTKLIK